MLLSSNILLANFIEDIEELKKRIMILKICPLLPNFILPKKATPQASGFDLYACIGNPLPIAPLERVLVPTGFALDVPETLEAQIRSRSGLALHHGVTVLNGIGTIDSDFKGHIQVLLVNLSQKLFTLQPKDRMAQIVFTSKVAPLEFQIISELPSSQRDPQGFGSSGR